MGKRKSTTTTTESSSSSMTPTNPEWVSHTAQSLNTGIESFGGMDPYSLVAPASDLERQAAQGAAKLGQGWDEGTGAVGGDDWFANLLSGSAPSVNAASLLDNLGAYSNPYRAQVTDAAMADFDAEAGRTRAAQDLDLAGSSAFGGSGAALTRSLTEGELARARSTQYASLLSDMFNKSADLASQDAERRQQASLANAQLALQDRQARAQMVLDRESADRANTATQGVLGQQMREIDQAQRLAPLTQLQSQIEMFSGLPLQLFQGQNSTSTGNSQNKTTSSDGFLGNLSKVVGMASSLGFSPLSGFSVFPPKKGTPV